MTERALRCIVGTAVALAFVRLNSDVVEAAHIGGGTLPHLGILKDSRKEYITEQFGLKKVAILENWLHAISNLRNCCAHHSRTWNRRFWVSVTLPYNTLYPFMNCQLSIVNYLHRHVEIAEDVDGGFALTGQTVVMALAA